MTVWLSITRRATEMGTDPAIDAIRQARHRISCAYDHDAARLIEHYKQMQDAFAGRITRGPEADAARRSSVLESREPSEHSERVPPTLMRVLNKPGPKTSVSVIDPVAAAK